MSQQEFDASRLEYEWEKDEALRKYTRMLRETCREVIRNGQNSEHVAITTDFLMKTAHLQNLHVRFLRLDLLEQFNKLAGGKRLRPGKAA